MVRPFCIAILLIIAISSLVARADAPAAATQPATNEPREPGKTSTLSHSSISIPLEDFQGLLNKENSPTAERPPVDFAFSSANYEATVAEKSVAITANIDVTILVDGWTLLPIGPSDSGVTGAAVDGQSAALVVRGDVLYALLKGKGSRKISLAISRDVVAERGRNRFDLSLVDSPLVSLSTAIPQKGLSVRAPGASGFTVTENPQGTIARGTFHAGMLAAVSWEPTPAVAAAEILTTTLTRVAVERGSLRCHAEINYEIIHAGADTLRIALPDGIDLTSVTGEGIRDNQTVADGKQKTLVVTLKEPVRGSYTLAVEYVLLYDAAKELSPSIPLLGNPGSTRERGFVGIEVRDSVEVTPTPSSAQRIDVKELPEALWNQARSPLLFAYRYDAAGAKVSLALSRNADVDVLVAMSDICEVATTYTPDGKSITKMMFVTRNNLKQFMTLKMPEGAQIWSAFVDDHPVTPAKNAKGDILIPLKKSEPEDADDDEQDDGKSYRARRERRRSEGPQGAIVERMKQLRARRIQNGDDAPPDLKPYDVEIVFVTTPVKFTDRGQVKPALPQSDIPIGHLSWAIFMPSNLRVVDAQGNVAEVAGFTLPFRHFGDVAYELGHKLENAKVEKMQQDIQAAAQQEQASRIASHAKAPGVLPVRIEIPMIGEIHRFEKFLTVDEAPAITLTYSRRVE